MDKSYVMDMLSPFQVRHEHALRQEAEVVAILLGQPISEVRSVLGVCLTNASKSTMSSLADRL